MSMDTRRSLKDALTEAIQASLHYLRKGGDFGELKTQLSFSLDELYGHTEPPPDKLPYVRAGVEKARLVLDTAEGAEGAVTLLDEALNALDEAGVPPQIRVEDSRQAVKVEEYAPKPSLKTEREQVRIGAPGASQNKGSYSGAKFDVSPEAFAEATPPTRREIADKIIDEVREAAQRTDIIDAVGIQDYAGGILSRLESVRGLVVELEADYWQAQTKRGDYCRALDQVLTYCHRRLTTFPPPDGKVHLAYVLKLATGATTLQSPPTDAEIQAATREAAELEKGGEIVDAPAPYVSPRRLGALANIRKALDFATYQAGDGDKTGEELVDFRLAIVKATLLSIEPDVEDKLDHIPGSILEELEGDLKVAQFGGDEGAAWLEDNLERVRILRGCFAAYAKGREEDAEPDVEGDYKAPEHEHNVLCLPYHSALREIERRINIYRDDTLEAHNDFGEEVVSSATITAVNTFTAQLIKIITDVAGDSKGYNKGTIEREAAEDKRYPKLDPLPTGAHNALVASQHALGLIVKGIREANVDAQANEAFITDRVRVAVRYNDYEYIREALKSVETQLKLELTGDMRLPVPQSAGNKLAEMRRRIEEQDGAPEVRQMIDDKLRAWLEPTPEVNGDGVRAAFISLEGLLRQAGCPVNVTEQGDPIQRLELIRSYMVSLESNLAQALSGSKLRDYAERLEHTTAYLYRVLHKRNVRGKDRMSYALSLATGRNRLVNPPTVEELIKAKGADAGDRKDRASLDKTSNADYELLDGVVEQTRQVAGRMIGSLERLLDHLTAGNSEEEELLSGGYNALGWLRAYFGSPEGAPITPALPPALLDRIRARADSALEDYDRAPLASGTKGKLHAALTEVSRMLKDASHGSPRLLRFEITEGTHHLATVSAIELINTLHAALWTCEAERNISSSLGMLAKIRATLLTLDAKAGETSRLREELEVAENEAERAQGELRDINSRQVLANEIHAERDRQQSGTIAALRADNELLSKEAELYHVSLIAYLFVINRLKSLAKANIDAHKAYGKAIGQLKTGQILQERPEWVEMDRAGRAEKLLEEIEAIAESARSMGEEELELLAKAAPIVTHKITEGLTED